MKKYTLYSTFTICLFVIVITVSCNIDSHSDSEKGIVNRIDHVLIVPENPSKFFSFLSEELQLPIVWNYQSFGDFSTGGVFSGNVNLEVLHHNGLEAETSIGGIAFEPLGTTEETITQMDQRKIKYKEPVFNGKPVVNNGKVDKRKCWTTTDIENILPGSWIFFCEYYFDKAKRQLRNKERKELLEERNGGPLGIEYVSEISLMVDSENRMKDWRNLLAPVNEKTNYVFEIGDGPTIRFVKSDRNCIYAIRFHVKSIETVRSYLVGNKIIGNGDVDVITTNPDKTYGVLFEFSEL